MPDLAPDTIKAAIVRALDSGMTLSPESSAQEMPKRGHGKMHAALGVMGAGQLADALSTASALKRDGTREANDGVYGDHPSMARVMGTKAAIMVPAGFALDKLYDKSPKAALITALALGGLGMGLAAHNAKVGK